MKNIVLYILLSVAIILLIKSFSLRLLLIMFIVLGLLYTSTIVAAEIHGNTKKRVQRRSKEYYRQLNQSFKTRVSNFEEKSNIEYCSYIGDDFIHRITTNNEVNILNTSDEAGQIIINQIKSAKNHIHMEYFIIKNGKIADRIKDILIKKLQEGIKVRIIYDGYGSFLLKTSYISELERAGAELVPFSPVFNSLINMSINHRNHRKILIVDGKIGIIGDSNIADEYFGKETNLGKWRDLDVLIKGEAVHKLQAIFLKDWYLATGKNIEAEPQYFPEFFGNATRLPLQIVSGGLDSKENQMEHLFLSFITSAREELLIQTPYFVPTESIIIALESLIDRGVTVRLMIPVNSDNVVAEYATDIYAQRLRDAGAFVYKYTRGFLHSKIIVKDNDASIIGTANVDHRGLRLDYEVLALFHDKTVTNSLREIFIDDVKGSMEIDKSKEGQKGFKKKLGERIIYNIKGIL